MIFRIRPTQREEQRRIGGIVFSHLHHTLSSYQETNFIKGVVFSRSSILNYNQSIYVYS